MATCFICRMAVKKTNTRRKPTTTDLLGSQVSAIFMLQKLLDIPSAVCVDIISSNGNPSTWLSYCNSCVTFLQETQILFSKAVYFQKKFQNAKEQLKNDIKTSHKDRKLTREKFLKNRNNLHIPDYFLSLYFEESCEADDTAGFDSTIVIKEEYYDSDGDHDDNELIQQVELNENDIISRDYDNILENTMNSPANDSRDEDWVLKENRKSDSQTAESLKSVQSVQNNNVPLKNEKQLITKTPMKFQCIYCEYSSRHRESWKVHTRRHHTKETPYSCELCDAKFCGRKDVYNHFPKAHPGKKPTPMINTSSRKMNKGKSRNSVKSNVKNKILKLDSTKLEPKIEDGLLNENQNSNNEGLQVVTEAPKKFVCSYCDYSTGHRVSFRVHTRREHTKETPYSCELCDEKFFGRNDVYRHFTKAHPGKKPTPMINKIPEKPLKFRCSYCDFSSKHRVSLRVHTRRKHTKETPYPCELCDKKFFGRNEVYRHFEKAHPGKKPTPMINRTSGESINDAKTKPRSSEFVCKLCGRDCKNKATFETHMNYHKKEKTIICDLCSERFYNVTILSWHQRSMHYKELDLEPFQCKECGKMLSGPKHLEKHIISQHTKKFDFICKNCGAGFTDKHKLVNHMRVRHGLEKPFECPICFEKLVSRTRVNEHIQMHTGKYEHVCSLCEKGFTSSSELKRHMKYHASDFPHKRKSRLASKVKCPIPPSEHLPTLENPILPVSNSMQQRANCGLRKYPFSKKSRFDYDY